METEVYEILTDGSLGLRPREASETSGQNRTEPGGVNGPQESTAPTNACAPSSRKPSTGVGGLCTEAGATPPPALPPPPDCPPAYLRLSLVLPSALCSCRL